MSNNRMNEFRLRLKRLIDVVLALVVALVPAFLLLKFGTEALKKYVKEPIQIKIYFDEPPIYVRRYLEDQLPTVLFWTVVSLIVLLCVFWLTNYLVPGWARLAATKTLRLAALEREDPYGTSKQSDETSRRDSTGIVEFREEIQRSQAEGLKEIRALIESQEHGIRVAELDSERLIAATAAEIRNALTSATVKEVRAQYGGLDLEHSFDQTKGRLGNAIRSLAKRVNLNLWSGLYIAAIGLAVLGYFVFSIPKEADAEGLLLFLFPRITVALAIQVFSFFFLNLYKSGLKEMMFYQNELTGAEARYASMQVALASGDREVIKEIATRLSRVERNFEPSAEPTKSKPDDAAKALKDLESHLETLTKIIEKVGKQIPG